jgi:hypothetical protein
VRLKVIAFDSKSWPVIYVLPLRRGVVWKLFSIVSRGSPAPPLQLMPYLYHIVKKLLLPASLHYLIQM